MSKRSGNTWDAPNPERYIVQMKNLTSTEVYKYPSGEQVPVLRDNTLDVCRGESWAVVGREAFEIEMLLQIMGCVRPYGSGSCRLVERGMMRKKRRVLPHVFFVGSSGMAVPNMNVLEYLMFATSYTRIPAKKRQTAFLQIMLECECYGWCMAPVKALSPQERAVLSLFAASFSSALLFIFPYFHTETTPELRRLLRFIAQFIAHNRCALVMGVCDPTLAEEVCTHAAFLLDGTLRQRGTISEIKREWDKRDFVIATSDGLQLAERIHRSLSGCQVRARRREVEVYHIGDTEVSQAELLSAVEDIPVKSIRKSEKTLENAFTEAQYDLSNELL